MTRSLLRLGLLSSLVLVAGAPTVATAQTPEDLPPGETMAQGAVPLKAPVQILSRDGRIETDLYVQFARTTLPGSTGPDGSAVDTIWTRAYGLDPVTAGQPLPMLDIPGPTFVYFPGDWLQITLHNQLNRALDPLLAEFEDEMDALASQDDIQTPVPHEINIPHNADNTNLHVHGMHVDPKQDDVTLILVPEDDNPSHYTPSLQRFIPDINAWWRWRYGYRLPIDHLPGTHWYHDHKHGATSTHVENGMAGTLLLRPPSDDLAIVPGLWNDDPALSRDTPLVLQEIANYGAQQGGAVQRTDSLSVDRQAQNTDQLTTDWPEITVNGQHQPVRVVGQGETQRWRVVTAGSNHRTASFLWVAKLTPPATLPDSLRIALESITDYTSACPYITIGAPCTATPAVTNLPDFEVAAEEFPGTVQMVALDGITLKAPLDLMAQPALLGPGNRVDLIIQPDADAPVGEDYYLLKNFNVAPPLYVLARHPAYGDLFADPEAGYWRYLALTTYVGGTDVVNTYEGTPSSDPSSIFHPFLDLSGDPYALGTDRSSYTQPWPKAVGVDGALAGAVNPAATLVPLLSVTTDGPAPSDGMSVEIVGQTTASGAPTGLGWNVPGGAGLVDAQPLMTISVVEGSGGGPQPPTADWMSRISPTTDDPAATRLTHVTTDGVVSTGIPAYVAPITDADIVGQQVVVFDQSGIKFIYEGDTESNTKMQQFTLNGRQFDLDDYVGNPMADHLIEEPVPGVVPNAFVSDRPLGRYVPNGGGSFTNRAVVDGDPTTFFTNPGYYREVVAATAPDGSTYYTFASTAAEPPSYAGITGLPTPIQPMAQTAEEWVLINNSGAFHPFHIHINPLFLTEVGQLNYDGSAWGITELDESDELGYVLNNWWDVVIIPPNGYVTFRTWMNIPNQRPEDPTDPASDFVVDENANVYGSWVYHCHILRHEDRGMMMVVNVRPKPEPAPAGGR